MKKTLLISAIVMLTGIAYGQVTNGLVAKYSFNNGNANDEVGSNNGIVNGATLTTDRFGNTGKAYYFNDNGDNIDLGNSPTLKPTNGSISLWFRRTAISNNGIGYLYNPVIMNKAHSGGAGYEGYCIYITTTDSKIVPVTTDTTNFSQTFFSFNFIVQDSVWTHVVLTYDSDSLKLYINNSLDKSAKKNYTSLFSSLYSVVLGHNTFDMSNNRSFKGDIDDIRIYNRVLTSLEIDTLFNESNPMTTGINNILATNNSIDIYPNPTNSQINFSVQTNVQLSSVTGQILLDKKNVNSLDLSNQPAFTF